MARNFNAVYERYGAERGHDVRAVAHVEAWMNGKAAHTEDLRRSFWEYADLVLDVGTNPASPRAATPAEQVVDESLLSRAKKLAARERDHMLWDEFTAEAKLEYVLRAHDALAAHLHTGYSAVPAVLMEIMAEVERAIVKFPTWPTDPLHALGVLGEEFGELGKAVLQQVYEPQKNEPGDVRKEAVQTAAMALRFLASMSDYRFKPSDQHQQQSLAGPAAVHS